MWSNALFKNFFQIEIQRRKCGSFIGKAPMQISRNSV